MAAVAALAVVAAKTGWREKTTLVVCGTWIEPQTPFLKGLEVAPDALLSAPEGDPCGSSRPFGVILREANAASCDTGRSLAVTALILEAIMLET